MFEGRKSRFKQQVGQLRFTPLADRILICITSLHSPPAKSRKIQSSSVVAHSEFKAIAGRPTRENVNITDRMFSAVYSRKTQLKAVISSIANELSQDGMDRFSQRLGFGRNPRDKIKP